MNRVLMILEVSKKQDYILGSKKLKENAARSEDIRFITSSEFFESVGSEFYSKAENYVYAGGGHSVLQFADKEIAKQFSQRITDYVLRVYEGLELFVKIEDYDETKTPGENLKRLSKELERKKSLRADSFHRSKFGFEVMDTDNTNNQEIRSKYPDSLQAPQGMRFPIEFEQLRFSSDANDGIQDNFIAVVHVDGNAMGARVDAIYQKYVDSWDEAKQKLKLFSDGIQRNFEEAFTETVREVLKQGHNSSVLPIRPVIIAGDDVCFVTAGSIGIECAKIFLEKLAAKKNAVDGISYSACAGVAMVHRKYPFHQAYQLAEELCGNAKKYGASLDIKSRLSVIDWHIEFGQLKGNLESIRKMYECEDGNRMELRPYVVVNSSGAEVPEYKNFFFFKELCKNMQKNHEQIARSKVKTWRIAIKQGKLESEFLLRNKEMEDILYHVFSAMNRSEQKKMQHFEKVANKEEEIIKEVFVKLKNERYHCLFFDAIELMDHCLLFEEAYENE